MERSDHLGQLRRRDPAPEERANEGARTRDAGELCEDFGREADGEEGREDTGRDAQDAEDIALSCGLL